MNRSRVTGDLASQGNIFVDIANDRVGIGSTIPTQKLDVVGTVKATAFSGDGSGLSGVTSVGGDTGADFNDSVKVRFGTGNDLELYHDGSHSYIHDGGTGNLKVRSNNFRVSNADESKLSATFQPAGAVELYHNNVKMLETTAIGLTISGDVKIIDGENLRLGDSNDLIIYHTGSHSFIDHSGAGNLYIRTLGTDEDLTIQAQNDVFIKCANGEDGIRVVGDGEVKLYHDTAEKLATTSSGINVTGKINVDNQIVLNSEDSTPARIDLYCEVSNAHYTRLQAPAHSTYSGNVTVTIPNVTGNLAVLANAADNRVVTATGTHAMTGETDLTFDGTTLVTKSAQFKKNSNNYILVGSTDAGGATVIIDGDSNGDGSGSDYAYIQHDTSGNLNIVATNPADSSQIIFNTGDGSEALRIDSSGRVMIGNTAAGSLYASGNNLVVGSGSGSEGITVYTGNTNQGILAFADGTSGGAQQYAGYVIYDHNTNAMLFATQATERLQITSTGTVLKGLSTARANYGNNTSGVEYGFQIEATSATKSSLSLIRSSNDVNDGGIFIGKTRGSVGGNTVVQAGDDLGTITFGGADGTSLLFGAEILAEVQSGVGNDDMPTALIFKTNGGSTSTAERLRITSGGQLLLGTSSGGLATGDEFVISTSGHTGMTIRSGTSGEGNIFFGDSDYGASGIIRYDHSNDSMVFKTNSTGQERFSIASNGDVKVVARGSSDSGAPFYVAVTGKSSITYGGGNDDTACLRIKDTGSTNSYYHGLELRSRQGADVRLYCQDKGNDLSDFVIATDNGGIAERMRITAAGRVGIGNRTTSPDENLHVHTSSGQANIHVEGATDGQIILRAHSGDSVIHLGDASSTSVGKILYDHGTDSLQFSTNSSSRLTLSSTGKLSLTSNDGLFIRPATDSQDAKITFSTNNNNSNSQIGHIKYQHQDSAVVSNYGEGMIMGGTESNGFVLRVDGALNIKDSDSAGGDGAKLLLGTDKDMRIYHSGGDGFFDLTGSGGVRFRVNDLIFQNYNTGGGATRRVRFHGDEGIEVFSVTNGQTNGARIQFSDSSNFSQIGTIRYAHSDNSVVNDSTNECFVIEGTETQTALLLNGRFYMDDDKFVMKPNFGSFDNIPNSASTSHQGVMMRCDSGQASSGNSGVISNNEYEPFIANRTGTDGMIMRIRHQSNTEGHISVSGSQVSYSNFMGAHKAQFVDHSKPDILMGTVLETVDQLATWKYASFSVGVGTAATTKYIPYYGSKNDGETDSITFDSNTYSATIKDYRDPMPEITKHVCVKVSDTVGSKAVFGVFHRWEEDTVVERESGNAEVSWNDLDVGAIGNSFIRMQSGQTPEVGDYVESAGDGTAKVQSDDILRSKTIAKITSTIKQKTYSDGSFLVTCTLHCG